MANFPGMASVPLPAVQSSIPSNDWETVLDAWITLLEIRLNTPDNKFSDAASDDISGVSFLNSFYQQAAAGSPGLQHGPKGRTLRKLCFLATRRYILGLESPPELLISWQFLGNLCCCYPSSSVLKTTLSITWDRHGDKISSSMEQAKALIIKNLSSGVSPHGAITFAELRCLTILASVLPPCGQILMAGSDYLDIMTETYQKQSSRGDTHKILTANIYVGMVSLLKEPSPNLSLLLDQLFSLKASAGVGTPKMKKEATLLSDLVCSSDLLQRLENFLLVHPQKRGQDLLTSLRAYQTETKFLHNRYQRRRKTEKGKQPSSGPQIPEEIHAHKMSLVSQVQDLFPDLGSAFVVRLLDVYNDNPETVVAHLLDDSLPTELQLLDKTEQLPQPHSTNEHQNQHDNLAPHPTPPLDPIPTRKNIFDSDIDIASLDISDKSKGKIHFGRADQDQTADTVLADRSQHTTNKAAILSALAAFDSDDDERDDTYDVGDVGGTIDAAATSTSDADAVTKRLADDQLDMILYRAYKANPALFGRDAATRRSQPRASLKRETNMTDEAVEGWAVMLARDPKRMARFADRVAVEAGGSDGGALNQPELQSTSYRRPQAGSDDDSTEAEGSAGRGRGGGRGGRGFGRGRGRGRGGSGGAAAGGAGDSSSPAAHQRKEQNKASRANHNRRQQRAKKIARGGGLPG
jgi:activating signal cointegrator complex subunit 2